MAERIPMAQVCRKYEEWWNKVEAATREFQNSPEGQDGEDLSDFVDGIGTIFSFGPNPKTFPKEA